MRSSSTLTSFAFLQFVCWSKKRNNKQIYERLVLINPTWNILCRHNPTLIVWKRGSCDFIHIWSKKSCKNLSNLRFLLLFLPSDTKWRQRDIRWEELISYWWKKNVCVIFLSGMQMSLLPGLPFVCLQETDEHGNRNIHDPGFVQRKQMEGHGHYA